MSQKARWEKLLKRDFIQFPPNGNEYHVGEQVILTIVAKKNIRRRYYSCGGHYSATLNFTNPLGIDVTYLSPLKKPFFVKWEHIDELRFCYFSDKTVKRINDIHSGKL